MAYQSEEDFMTDVQESAAYTDVSEELRHVAFKIYEAVRTGTSTGITLVGRMRRTRELTYLVLWQAESQGLAVGTLHPTIALQDQVDLLHQLHILHSQDTALNETFDLVHLDSCTQEQKQDLVRAQVGSFHLKAQTDDKFGFVPSNETYPAIDYAMIENFSEISEEVREEIGGILSTKNWTLLANDAWLLGGLHARTTFHFASPLCWNNLWDVERKRMTVTARELIGIVASGYELKRPQLQLEPVAICPDLKNFHDPTLLDYVAAVKQYPSQKSLYAFYHSLPSQARD